MEDHPGLERRNCARGFLSRLLRDRAGNTLAMIAAAILPVMAMVGGGLDMGRSYLSQSKLQQACDAGVLAARKRLGTEVAVTGVIPDEAAETGQRFFNLNFRNGSYGTTDRTFNMTLEDDLSVSGTASVAVPTTLMQVFGFNQVDVKVDCVAQINMNNTDVMFVLDTTGSMYETNPGDSMNRIDSMRSVVKNFIDQLKANSSNGQRLRFGFVPYSTNVNVGGLLKDDWVVNNWKYQSRDMIQVGVTTTTKTYNRNWQYVSGTRSEAVIQSSYAATFHPGSPGSTTVDENENVVIDPGSGGYYSCDTPAPSSTYSSNYTKLSSTDYPFVGPPSGTQTVEEWQVVENGTKYWVSRSGNTCNIYNRTFSNYTQTYEHVTEPQEKSILKYRYAQLPVDVSDWRSSSNGCIEERDTYEITDYNNVDFSKALDLDIDLVPTANKKTKWRPMYPGIIYARSKKWDGSGSFTKPQQITNDEYIRPNDLGLASCPAPARKLATMTDSEVDSYLDSLQPNGQTYHDIGMIWGGRLLSPTGLFADENADPSPSQPVSRHLIFLTDGETAAFDMAYSSYGLEPLDQRRWDPSSSLTLTETVEKRFGVACREVRKRNITVWVIGFGTSLSDVFKDCAGPGHYFEAADSAQLNAAFSAIAKNMQELRITR